MIKDIFLTIFWLFLFLLPVVLTILIIVKKNKSALIGEIIGGVLGFIISFLIVIDRPTLNRSFIFRLITKPFEYPCMSQCVGEDCLACIVIIPIQTIYMLIMLGMLFGWIVGKIKNR